jgi:putative hydrolase of HD superfamily
MSNTNSDSQRLLQLMAELHALTKLQRTGWVMAGVRDAESVSDHCFEAAIIAVLLANASASAVDIGRVVQMLLFHEIAECRLTDLPRRAGPYIKEAKQEAEKQISVDLLSNVAPSVLSLLEEFHQRETPEARLAEAAEELQIVFCSLMYAKEGNGDMTEYVRDVENYPSYGVDLADAVNSEIGAKLKQYLNGKDYWPLGYDRPIQ